MLFFPYLVLDNRLSSLIKISKTVVYMNRKTNVYAITLLVISLFMMLPFTSQAKAAANTVEVTYFNQ